MSRGKFSRAFKTQVAMDYVQSKQSAAEIAVKYGLPNAQTVINWKHCYVNPCLYVKKSVSLQLESNTNDQSMASQDSPIINPAPAEQDAKIALLQQQLRKAEVSLKRAEDKILALNTLIDIAEERGMHIRKKSGVKQ